eukprot:1266493-Amphidinium_carterae.1
MSFKDASENVSMPDPDYYDERFDAFNEGQEQLRQQTARVAEHVEQSLRERHLKAEEEHTRAREMISQQQQALAVTQQALMRSHDDMGRMGQMAKDELERMRGQKKQKPETDIVREGATALKKATPPTGFNPVPLPPPPKAKSSDIVPIPLAV